MLEQTKEIFVIIFIQRIYAIAREHIELLLHFNSLSQTYHDQTEFYSSRNKSM